MIKQEFSKFVFVLFTACFSFSAKINLETSVEHQKLINGDAGLELLVKSSIRLNEVIPSFDFMGAYIGLGASQQYTAPRSSQFAYNHYGDRFDWAIGCFFGGIEVIYTHSIRNKFDGAYPDVLFINESVDSIKVRFKNEVDL
jgi:hypothetical protein